MNKIFLRLCFAWIALGLAGCATRQNRDVTKIQGTWSVVGGRPLPAQLARMIVLKMHDGNYEVQAERADRGSYTLDASVHPGALDVYGVDGPNAGKHFPCIYELHGDVLKICYQLGDGPRPAQFTSPAGTKIFLATYQRKSD